MITLSPLTLSVFSVFLLISFSLITCSVFTVRLRSVGCLLHKMLLSYVPGFTMRHFFHADPTQSFTYVWLYWIGNRIISYPIKNPCSTYVEQGRNIRGSTLLIYVSCHKNKKTQISFIDDNGVGRVRLRTSPRWSSPGCAIRCFQPRHLSLHRVYPVTVLFHELSYSMNILRRFPLTQDIIIWIIAYFFGKSTKQKGQILTLHTKDKL